MAYKISTIFTANYDQLKNTITGVKSQFKSIEQQAQSMKNNVNSSMQNTGKTSPKIERLNEQLQKVQSEFSKADMQAKELDKTLDNIRSNLADKSGLKLQYETSQKTSSPISKKEYESKLDKLVEEDKEYNKILNKQIKLTEQTEKHAQSISTIKGKLQEAGKEIEKIDFTKVINTGLKASAVGVATISAPILLASTNALKMAGSFEAAEQTIAFNLGKAKSIIDDFAQNNATSLGMAKQEVYKFANIYSNLLTTMTNDQTTNATMTKKLLQASSVVATKTGRTVTDVADRIRSGLLGNTEAIEDLGINVNVALLETTEAFKKLSNGKSWDKLSFQTQQQIRLLGILEQTSKKFGEESAQNLSLELSQNAAMFQNVKTEASQFLAVGLQPLISGIGNILNSIMVFVRYLNSLDDNTKKTITTFALIIAVIPVVALVFFTLIKAINSYVVWTQTANASTVLFTKSVLGLLGTTLLLVAGIAMIAYSLGAFDNFGKSVNKTTKPSTSATKAVNGLSNAQNNNAKSAKDASKANKELADNLQGFDEINKLSIDSPLSGDKLDTLAPTVDLSGIDLGNSFNNLDSQFDSINDKVDDFKINMENLKPVLKTVGSLLLGLGLTKLITDFTKLIKPTKNLTTGVTEATTGITKFSVWLKKAIPIVGGTMLAMEGASNVQKAWGEEIYDTTEVSKDLTKSQRDAAVGTMELAAGGALIGSVFGPVGAVIGGVAGAIVGLIMTIVNYNEALNTMAKNNIYGTMQLNADQLEQIGNQITSSYQKQSDQLSKYKSDMDSLTSSVDDNIDSLQSMSFQFNSLGQQISQEDAQSIFKTIDSLATNSVSLVDESMTQTLQILKSTFEKTNVMTKDEETNMLKTTVEANKIRKDRISEAQNNITKTYENAIKTRGYLTDDEYIYISEQLNKIKELTNTQMQISAGEQEKLKRQINDRNSKLDEESYNRLAEQLKTSNENALKLIEENYNQRYAEAVKAGEDAKLLAESQGKSATEQEQAKQDAINSISRTLQAEYNQDIKNANTTTEQLRSDYTKRLLEDWKVLNQKNSSELTETEKRQKKFLEEMLSNFGISGTDLIKKAKETGTNAGSELSINTTNNINWRFPTLPSLTTDATRIGKDGANSLNTAWNKGLNLGISNLPRSIMFDTETSGNSLLLKPRLNWYAKGGVFTGASIIGVGEYANARSNPEIATPQSLMYDTMIKANKDTKQNNDENNNTKIVEVVKRVEFDILAGGVKLGKKIIDLLDETNDFYGLEG